jgi:hypothetical protein
MPQNQVPTHTRKQMFTYLYKAAKPTTGTTFRSPVHSTCHPIVPAPDRTKTRPRSFLCMSEWKEIKDISNGSGGKHASDAPFPKKKRVPLGVEYLLLIWCSWRESTGGPQKNTPTSVSVCFSVMLVNTRSQFGRPKCVGARRAVMASFSAPTSCTNMFVMSSSLILAVRYMLISMRFCMSCSSIACRSEWNHSAEPKSRMTHVK